MQFKYEAKDIQGKTREGVVVAEDQEHAENLIQENGLTIVSMTVLEESLLDKIWPFGKSVPAKDMVLFSRQLSTLIGAKVTILQSLRILREQVSNKRLQNIIDETVQSIEGGNSFSLSLARHPEVFSNVYISVVHTGELSGTLENSLNYLADQMEKDYELGSKVRSAMIYPAFILGAIVVVGSLMFLFILPKLTDILEQNGGSLPFITVMLIDFTKFFQVYWWTFLVGAIGLFWGGRAYIRTVQGRYVFDRLKITFPIIKGIFEQIYIARFARNLSTLVLAGIPIIKALEVVSELVNNVIYRDIIREAAQKLAGGKSIAESLAGHKEIPVIVTQMIQVGEQSAALSSILQKLAVYYEKEVDTKVSTLTTLIEPIIILILGLAVGILVAGILLPIYNLASTTS
ncbi:type II secretion system F family protein [Patescibacteria group bacterium]|nr:type II secretion system F family protein [Patescibacteria group bacterium]